MQADLNAKQNARLPDNIIYQSANAAWVRLEGDNVAGPKCAVAFNRGSVALIFADTYGDKPGTITFAGPHIPSAQKLSQTHITVSTKGKPAKMHAIHMPLATGRTVLIVPTMIKQTVQNIGDSETLEVKLNSKAIFSSTQPKVLLRHARLC